LTPPEPAVNTRRTIRSSKKRKQAFKAEEETT